MVAQRLLVEKDGSRFIETYSTDGFKILQNETGIIYDTAIDPEEHIRSYTETDELIEQDDDSQRILEILMGGNP